MSSRQEFKVEHKVSVAAFTSRDEKWVGEGREEDTTEERWEGERDRRFRLKVTGRGVGFSYPFSVFLLRVINLRVGGQRYWFL